MSGRLPRFMAEPFTYLRWASRERPAYFWSIVLGAMGPVFLIVVPPIRRYVGDDNAPRIPNTYPIPTGPRKQLKGFED